MRVFVYGKHEKRITAIFLTVVFALLIALPWASAAEKLLPIYRVHTQECKIALTFDVAWEATDLDAILSILSKNNAKATFFITGDFASRLPHEVKKICDAGHDVQNHSNAHPHVAKLPSDKIFQDAADANNTLKSITEKDTCYYRSPYGEYNNTVINALSPTYQIIQWDVDSRDWKPDAQADTVSRFVCENTKSGSILLFHVGSKAQQTEPALMQILKNFSNKFQTVLLPELIPKQQYSINSNGELFPN